MPDTLSSSPCPGCGAPVSNHGIVCIRCGRELQDRRLGQVLGGRYRLDSRLGEGAYARVYQAEDLSAGGTVAVKFLHQRYASSHEQRQRFQREAEVLIHLSHPGIVRALDFGEHEGGLYLVMELVPGRPLSEVVASGEVLALERVVAIVDQVLEVLGVTHAAGIVHRDLKPDNILLVADASGGERVKLLDFGLARVDPSLTRGPRLTGPNMPIGTPRYMSPEQAAGEDAGPPADVYAVGIILFLLLAGTPPFQGDSPRSLMAQHMVSSPPSIASRSPGRDVPPAFEEVARCALAKAPAQRPSVESLRRMLRAALAAPVSPPA